LVTIGGVFESPPENCQSRSQRIFIPNLWADAAEHSKTAGGHDNPAENGSARDRAR